MGKTLLLSICLHSLLLYAAAITLVRERQVFVVDLRTEAASERVEGKSQQSKRDLRRSEPGKELAGHSALPTPSRHAETTPSAVAEKTIAQTLPNAAVSVVPATVSVTTADVKPGLSTLNNGLSSTTPAGTVPKGTAAEASPSVPPGKGGPDPAAAIRAAVERALIYPPLARRRHMEGKVIVRFSIDEKGVPLSIRVVESSGHPMLDDEAVRTVARAAPLPVTGGSVEIPINFRLLTTR